MHLVGFGCFAAGAYFFQQALDKVFINASEEMTKEKSQSYIKFVQDRLWMAGAAASPFCLSVTNSTIIGVSLMAQSYILTRHYPTNLKGSKKKITPIACPIPDRWVEDRILKQFICVITKTPIREAIKDPTTKDMYDKSAILKWVRRNPSSPITRKFMNWIQVSTHKLHAVQGLIDYRIQQLESLEKELGRPLDPIKDRLSIQEGAEKVDKMIARLFMTKLEDIKEIPEFLGRYPGLMRCHLSGKPIRTIVAPNVSQESLKENKELVKIVYEESVLRAHITKDPNEIPKNWPVSHCPLPIKDKDIVSDVRQAISDQSLELAIDELRHYYKCFLVDSSKLEGANRFV